MTPADPPQRPGAPAAPTSRRRRLRRRLGLRAALTTAFAAGGLALALLLSVGTYVLARNVLIEQRETNAVNQAYAEAAYVRSGLLTPGAPVNDVLALVSPPSDSVVYLRRNGAWYSTSMSQPSNSIPADLARLVAAGGPGLAWTRVGGRAAVVVGVPLPAVQAEFYEVTLTGELERTLDILGRVLAATTALTVIAGALVGRWASGRVLVPLEDIAQAAARIAGGDLSTRLPRTDDPELVTIIGSFNTMVDTLAERLERDARFTADVSHELRSPLTTLTTSVQLLEARRSKLPERAQRALDLMTVELARFRTMLEDLLELGRLDSGEGVGLGEPVDAAEFVRQCLSGSGREPGLLRVPKPVAGPEEPTRYAIRVDKLRMARALTNLFVNADLHGDGLAQVWVGCDGGRVLIEVHDGGPGVAAEDRTRVFDRFVRGGSRGSRPGAGLGLSLVNETVRAHGGTVRVGESALGGAVFTLSLPAASAPTQDLPIDSATQEIR